MTDAPHEEAPSDLTNLDDLIAHTKATNQERIQSLASRGIGISGQVIDVLKTHAYLATIARALGIEQVAEIDYHNSVSAFIDSAEAQAGQMKARSALVTPGMGSPIPPAMGGFRG